MLRKTAVGVGVSAAVAGLLVTMAGAQILRDRPNPAREGRTYVGGSDRNDFQEALGNAIEKAQRAIPGADRLIRYRVTEMRGESGGIAGRRHFEVEIELTENAGGPGQDPDDGPRNLERVLIPELRLSRSRVSRDESLDLTFSVRNTADREVALRFARGQRYELEVYKGERVLWRWSTDRSFIARDQNEILRSGQSLTYRETLNLRRLRGANGEVPTGDLTVRAFFLPDGTGRRISDEQVLTVTR